MKKLFNLLFIFLLAQTASAQTWVMKENILKFPNNFESWLIKHNGGVAIKDNQLGSNQGVEFYDFNRDGKQDLLMQILPSNNITREYLKGIFLQDSYGYFNLDTNYVIKGKGDMWFGACGDFNGDGLTDYHYITSNYHGVDSNRKYSPEMINDNWPERVLINNGKSFDTLTLDHENIKIMSSYVADVNNDGNDDIITTSRDSHQAVVIYSYNLTTKKMERIKSEVTQAWEQKMKNNQSSFAILNFGNYNSAKEFATVYFDKAISGISTPYAFSTFNFTSFNFKDLSFKEIDWERKERTIPKLISGTDQDDVYKFSLYEIPCIYKIDIDDDSKYEYVAAGYYQNDYSLKTLRNAYGLQIFSEDGKEVTSKYHSEDGYDDNIDLGLFSLDIDRENSGDEIIPSAWGVRTGGISYFYIKKNSKLQKKFIKIVDINGKQIQDNKLTAKSLKTFPNSNGINGMLLYDFHDLKATSLIIQEDCSKAIAKISASGATTFCKGGKVTLTANEGNSYLWSTGAITPSIVVNEAGNFTVTVVNSNGCSVTSAVTVVSVSDYPNAIITTTTPTTITQTGNVVLSANTGTGLTYQWYKDGTTINAASSETYTARTAGLYTVKIQNSIGCETLSNSIIVKTVFVLPANNYQINIQGETCRTSDNGKIAISAVQNLSYTATLSKSGQAVKTANFNTNNELTGLAAGNYTLCLTVAGQTEYKQCYELIITEPLDLSVYSKVNPVNNTLDLLMSGGDTYYITLNGEKYISYTSKMSLGLKSGLNKITVNSSQICQGLYTEEIYVDEKIQAYPNPFSRILNLKIENQENKELLVRVFDRYGLSAYEAKHLVVNNLVTLDLSKLDKDYYFVVIGKQTFKVIKQ
jgi:hypothetical protein